MAAPLLGKCRFNGVAGAEGGIKDNMEEVVELVIQQIKHVT